MSPETSLPEATVRFGVEGVIDVETPGLDAYELTAFPKGAQMPIRPKNVIYSTVRDTTLLDGQKELVNPNQPVVILLSGACGNLLSKKGFFEEGAGGFQKEFGDKEFVTYILCDVYPKDSPQALAAVESARINGNYRLHSDTPYICRGDIEKAPEILRQLGVDIYYGATPPKVHAQDIELVRRFIELCPGHTLMIAEEKPLIRPSYAEQELPPVIEASEKFPIIGVDFFLYASGFGYLRNLLTEKNAHPIGKNLPDFGDLLELHTTCVEPHGVNAEKDRWENLMIRENQGGYLAADQITHLEAEAGALLRGLYGNAVPKSVIDGIFRARDNSVRGDPMGETAAVMSTIIPSFRLESENRMHPPIKVLSTCGKGLQLRGGADHTPQYSYMISALFRNVQIEACFGDVEKRLPAHVLIRPISTILPSHMITIEGASIFCYQRVIADLVIAAQHRKNNQSVPESVANRLTVQTEVAIQAMGTLSEFYRICDSLPDTAPQMYGSFTGRREPFVPPDLQTLCRVSPLVRRNPASDGKNPLTKEKIQE